MWFDSSKRQLIISRLSKLHNILTWAAPVILSMVLSSDLNTDLVPWPIKFGPIIFDKAMLIAISCTLRTFQSLFVTNEWWNKIWFNCIPHTNWLFSLSWRWEKLDSTWRYEIRGYFVLFDYWLKIKTETGNFWHWPAFYIRFVKQGIYLLMKLDC